MTELASKLAAREQAFSAAEREANRNRWKEKRRYPRKSVILACTLETPHGTRHCIALDLSLGGARIRVHEKLEPLDQVTLELAKFGRFAGHVVWRNATEAGLQFSDTPEEVALRFGEDFFVPVEGSSLSH